MDSHAVQGASEKQLKDLGLTQIGHIVALKSLCRNSANGEQQKSLLADIIKQSSKDRQTSNLKKKSQYKIIIIGWQHFDRNKRKFVCMRECRGGGIRKHKFNINASADEIMDVMESFYYPNGRNKVAGRLFLQESFIGNSSGEMLGSRSEGFSLCDYLNSNEFNRVRLYLCTKRKSITEMISYDLHSDESDFDIPSSQSFFGKYIRIRSPVVNRVP